MWQQLSLDGQSIDLSKLPSLDEPVAIREETFDRCPRITIWNLPGYIHVVDSADGRVHVRVRGAKQLLQELKLAKRDKEVELIYRNQEQILCQDRNSLTEYAQLPRTAALASRAVSGYLPLSDDRVLQVQIAEVLNVTVELPRGVLINYFSAPDARLQVDATQANLQLNLLNGGVAVAQSVHDLNIRAEKAGSILMVEELKADEAILEASDSAIILIKHGQAEKLRASATDRGSIIEAQVAAKNARLFVTGRGEVAVRKAGWPYGNCELRRAGAGIIRVGKRVYRH